MKKTFRILHFCTVLSAVLVVIAFASLPPAFETLIEQQASLLFNTDAVNLDIQKIGLSNIHISGVRIADSFSLASADIGYRISPLRGVSVSHLSLAGLTVNAALDENNRLVVSGIYPELFSGPENGSAELDPSVLSFLPERIMLQHAAISLKTPDGEKTLPFEAAARISRKQKAVFIDASLVLLGQKLSAAAGLGPHKGLHSVRVALKAFEPDVLDGFVPESITQLQLSAPFDLFLEQKPDNSWAVRLSPVMLEKPSALVCEDMKAAFSTDSNSIKSNGSCTITLPGVSALPLEFDFDLQFKNGIEFSAYVQNRKEAPLAIRSGENSLVIEKPSLKLFFKGNQEQQTGGLSLAGDRALLKGESRAVRVLDVSLSGEGTSNLLTGGSGAQLTCAAALERTDLTFDSSSMSFQKITSTVTVTHHPSGTADLQGKLAFQDFPEMEIHYAASLGPAADGGLHGNFDMHLKPFLLSSSQIDGFLPPALQTAEFEGMVSSSISASYADGRITTSLTADIDSGAVSLPEINFTAQGIRTNLHMNDLLVPESLPGQSLTIDTVSLDTVAVDDVTLAYSIEDGQSVLIENARFKWCSGIVAAESVRLSRENKKTALTLYCDRLALSPLLEQLGVFRAEGTGTVSGRIPVTYADGTVSFENGFLFSSPGSGGKIIIENSDRITEGLSSGTPEFSQLDLAREALKNFDYTWATISLNSVGDTLHVAMGLDGKPAKPLPFIYREDIGSFVRVDAASPGSRFQGIKLDVNLKLPFNEVLQLGTTLKNSIN